MFDQPVVVLVLEVIFLLLVVSIILVILMENRNPLKTISWILVLVFLPILGVILYLLFGEEHRKKYRVLRKLYKNLDKTYSPDIKIEGAVDYPEEYQQLVSLLQRINDSFVLSGNKIDFYTSGKDKFNQLFADIDKAKHHVHLDYYKFEDTQIAYELRDLLVKKAKQGVEVRVIYDDFGSIKVKKKFFDEMKQSGIQVEAFLPIKAPFIVRRVNYRNHRKIAIIDGRIAYTGGMNIGNSYIDGLSWGKWKDIQIRIEGCGVWGLQKVFLLDWYFTHKSIPQPDIYFPEMDNKGDNPLQVVSSGPIDAYNSIERGMFQSINDAKYRLLIQTPYFMPSENVLNALQTAALRGVDVRVMLPYRSDSFFVDRTTHSYVKDLLRYDIKVYLYQGGFLHTKSMIVDDSLTILGSANLDIRSFELSFETNTFIYSKDVVSKAKDVFDSDLLESEEVTIENWTRRPVLRKFMEAIMRLFSPLM